MGSDTSHCRSDITAPPALRCVSPPGECSGIQEEGAGHARRSHTWKHQGRPGCSGGEEEMWARAISVKGPAGAGRGKRAWDWLAPGGAVSPGSARQRCQRHQECRQARTTRRLYRPSSPCAFLFANLHVTSGNSEDNSFSEFCESVYCLNLRVVLGTSSHSC